MLSPVNPQGWSVHRYTEDTLVQQTTADYLEEKLGWESVYAYNDENFGPRDALGRTSDHEVVLTRYLRAEARRAESRPAGGCLRRRRAADCESRAPRQTLLATNREKYSLLRDGVLVTFRNDKGELVKQTPARLRFRPSGE